MLQGKKTYLGIIALFILGGLKAIGVLDENTYQVLLPIILGWTSYGIYDHVKRGDK